MKPEIQYDDTLDVLRLSVIGKFTQNELAESIAEINELLKNKKHRNILADVSGSARVLPSKDDRKAMAELAKDLKWDRIAVLGADPVLRISSKVILAVIGKSKEAQFFKTEDEALEWLKKGEAQ